MSVKQVLMQMFKAARGGDDGSGSASGGNASGSASGTGSMPAQQTTNAGSTLAVGALLAAVAFLFAL